MPAVLKCPCHGIIFSWNTGNLLSAGKIPEKNIKQQFRMITGIIILHGILSRRMEMSGRIIQPHIIYSYSAVLYFFGFMGLWYQVLRARCQQYYIKGVLQTHRHLNLVFSDFMCRCVVCRSASVPLLCNILALAQETVRHKHRITANYHIFGNLWNRHNPLYSRKA